MRRPAGSSPRAAAGSTPRRARAGRGFAALDEPGREAVVARAAEAPEGSDPRRFFEQTRIVAFFYYYSDAASWPALGYDGPPQPAGFMDYAEPPAPGRP